MPFQVDNLSDLTEILQASLSRFLESPGSIRIPSVDGPRKVSKSSLVYRLPKEAEAKKVSEGWKNDRRSIPQTGILFPDNSVMTILFDCKAGNIPGNLKQVASEIAIKNTSGYNIGYIEKYCYCFYPNSLKAEEEIGYFRYDFHIEAMGDGDLGEHSHFHLHRKVDGGLRLPTSAVTEFDKIVSCVERILAPQERKQRHERLFNGGKFEELLMDLTVDGVTQLKERMFDRKKDWNNFTMRTKYESFIANYDITHQ